MRLAALLRDAFLGLIPHRPLKMAAALSFYAALSLAPILVIVLGTTGLFLDRNFVMIGIAREMERVLGSGVGDYVRSLEMEQLIAQRGTLATVLGSVTVAFAATGIFVELQDDLDQLWGVKAKPQPSVLAWLRHRLLSLTIVAGIGFLLLVSFVVNGVLSLLAGPLEEMTGKEAAVGMILHSVVTAIGDTLFFALIFKVLPDVRVPWRFVWLGAAATAVLFVLGQLAIGAYLGRAAVGSAYGAAGSLVVMLVWVYYSSLIVLYGAELTRRIAVWRGYVAPPVDAVPTVPT